MSPLPDSPVSAPVIRQATAADLDAIRGIQEAAPEAAKWDPADYLAHHCQVAAFDHQVAGFLAARRVAEEETEILNLAVAPRFRRRGLARALLDNWLKAHPGRCFLEVRESNLAARRLYENAGFHVAGRRSEYYRNPPDAAIVMAFQIVIRSG